MQSKEAMGVDAQEMLHMQLGHKGSHEKIFKPTINEPIAGVSTAYIQSKQDRGLPKPPPPPIAQANPRLVDLAKQIRAAVEQRFKSGSEAFTKIKKAKPNKITAEELHAAMADWRVAATPEEAAQLVVWCDYNRSGLMDYKEFAKGIMKFDSVLSRSTL